LLAEDEQTLQEMTSKLENMGGPVGLRISGEKTKTMMLGEMQRTKIHIGQQIVEDVDRFTYLGSNLSKEGETKIDVNTRTGKAASVFQKLQTVWTSKKTSTSA